MRKITLDVDALEVESFATAERGAKKRGTVRGHSYPGFSCSETWDSYCPSISGAMDCDCAPCEGSASCP